MTSFPVGFLWGAASAAHQDEGGNVNADLWPQEWAPHPGFPEPSGDACDSLALIDVQAAEGGEKRRDRPTAGRRQSQPAFRNCR